LINPIKLCGSHFNLHLNDGSELRRHRLFETSFPVPEPKCNHVGQVLGVYGRLEPIRRLSNVNRRPKGDRKASRAEARELMQIDWMTDKELVEAIPPSYTEYIGREFLKL
jgi:DNA (cytosine-5)-methyltransferase 1